MAVKKKVEVELIFDADGAVTRIRDTSGQFLKLKGTVENTERTAKKGFRGISSSAAKYLGPLGALGSVTAMAFALKQMATDVIMTGKAFESSMSRVGALTGATASEMQTLTDQARKLGSTTVFSATEAAEGMQFLAMAGFSTSEIVTAMPGLLAQAAAGQIDLARASDITSNVLSGFNLTAAESGRVADVLTKASISSNTTIEGLGDTMKFVAPVAASLGLDLEELAAAAGILGDAGLQASIAGTSLRGSLLQLATPSKIQRTLMDQLGFSFTKANGETKSLVEIVADLEEQTKDMTKAQRTSTLAILVGQEAASGFTALIGSGSENLADFTKELKEAGGTAEEVATQQLDNLDGSLRLLKSAVSELNIALFDLFDDELREAVDKSTESVSAFSSMIEHLPTLLNAYRVVSANVNKAIAEGIGTIINPFGANPFQENIDYYASLAANAQDALSGTIFSGGWGQNGDAGGPVAGGGDAGDAGGTGGSSTIADTTKPEDRLTLLIKEREELIRRGAAIEELTRITSQITAIERERALLRESARIQSVDAADVELIKQEDLLTAHIKRTEAELDAAARRIRAAELEAEAKEKLRLADEMAIAQSIATSNTSIQTAGDAANAIVGSIRQIIQAKIAEAIAKAIASIPFPFNIAAGGVAAAGINLLFNKLVPKFDKGVDNFDGGLAMVHRDELLVNLSPGTSVIPKNETRQIIQNSFSSAGGDGALLQEMRAFNSMMPALIDGLGARIESRPSIARIDPFHFKDEMGKFSRQQSAIGNTAPLSK